MGSKEDVQKAVNEELSKPSNTKITGKGKGCLIAFAIFVGFIIIVNLIGDDETQEVTAPVVVQEEDEKKSDSVAVDENNLEETGQEQVDENKISEEKVLDESLSEPHFKDGNHIVGTDIQPGTYRTRNAMSGCYYSRLSGFGGTLDEIISNENTSAPAVVTISATDKGFKSTRCGTWTQDLSAITFDQTIFDDGIFIVGTDIQPGTYKSSGTDRCYYSRLSGFSGTLDHIISNENTNTAAVVTIIPTDKGFKSANCGTWTKVE